MKPAALLLIGQIAAGKSTLAQRLAQALPAESFSVEGLQENGASSPRGDELARFLAEKAAGGIVIYESSGAAADFEDLAAALGELGTRVLVVKLLCAPAVALERLRQRPWRSPKKSGAWLTELQWVTLRLRAVPADLTIDTESATPEETEATVCRFLRAHAADDWPPRTPLHGVFSYSRLATYERCPLAFRFRYLEDLPQAFLAEPTLLGESIHQALSWLYSPAAPRRTAEELLQQYGALLAHLPPACPPALRLSLLQKGEEMLRAHFAAIYLFDGLETIATEERLSLDLAPGIRFVGQADRMARTTAGTLVVLDYKTGSAREKYFSSSPDLLQLEFYALATLERQGVNHCEARRHDLRTGQEERIVVTDQDGRRIRAALHRWIRRVETSPHYDAVPGKYCSWCSYYFSCPHHAGPPSPGCKT